MAIESDIYWAKVDEEEGDGEVRGRKERRKKANNNFVSEG